MSLHKTGEQKRLVAAVESHNSAAVDMESRLIFVAAVLLALAGVGHSFDDSPPIKKYYEPVTYKPDPGYGSPSDDYLAVGKPDYVVSPPGVADAAVPAVPGPVAEARGPVFSDYFGQDNPFTPLWQITMFRVQNMEHIVKLVANFREEILLKISKLSHKVHAWCRSKKAMWLQ